MIKKLKQRFIGLAMVSLTILLALIVTGMNIINYREVVKDADDRLEVLEQNVDVYQDEIFPFDDFMKGGDRFFGKGGRGGPFMTRDEAEESRFFIVAKNTQGEILHINRSRISSVTDEDAAEYAETALESGKSKGFTDDFRYSISSEYGYEKITFLDCGRVLDSYRGFLRASIAMSLLGLLAVFGVLVYFAGRIVKPVAESYEKQKRFITDAGHEIKTPLAIIKANIDLAEIDPASTEDSLKEIDAQVDRLTNLTNDLVYLSRMEESDRTPQLSDVPVSEILTDEIASFDILAKEKSVDIKADVEQAVFIKGTAAETEKLISIVLENSVKYAPEGTDINISLAKDKKMARLVVGNNTAETQDKEGLSHVFERFYRTDSSRNSKTGGHGIGLSMANAIVNALGGTISADTTDGSDFIIDIELPLS